MQYGSQETDLHVASKCVTFLFRPLIETGENAGRLAEIDTTDGTLAEDEAEFRTACCVTLRDVSPNDCDMYLSSRPIIPRGPPDQEMGNFFISDTCPGINGTSHVNCVQATVHYFRQVLLQ